MDNVIMIAITFCWLGIGFWGWCLAADPNFTKVNIPGLLALFVFPFILLFTGVAFGMI